MDNPTEQAMRLALTELNQSHAAMYPKCKGGCPNEEATKALEAILDPSNQPSSVKVLTIVQNGAAQTFVFGGEAEVVLLDKDLFEDCVFTRDDIPKVSDEFRRLLKQADEFAFEQLDTAIRDAEAALAQPGPQQT